MDNYKSLAFLQNCIEKVKKATEQDIQFYKEVYDREYIPSEKLTEEVKYMKIGMLDLDTNYEYMIVYRDKRYDTINTWTLNESAFQVNYKQMKNSEYVEFLGVYKKLNDSQVLDVMTR